MSIVSVGVESDDRCSRRTCSLNLRDIDSVVNLRRLDLGIVFVTALILVRHLVMRTIVAEFLRRYRSDPR